MGSFKKQLGWMMIVCVIFGMAGSIQARLPDQNKMTLYSMLEKSRMISTGEDSVIVSPDSIDTEWGSISGHVSGVDSIPFKRIEVTAYQSDPVDGDYYKGYAEVDSSGNYTIEPLSPGDYILYVWAQGYRSQFYNGVENAGDAQPVTVLENEITANIDFTLKAIQPGVGKIEGTIIDLNGHPIANAFVDAWDPELIYNGRGQAQTDTDGNYEITGLASGEYYLYVYAENYIAEWYDNTQRYENASRLEVDENGSHAIADFQLGQGGKITGQVINENGSPVQNIVVEAFIPVLDSLEYAEPVYMPYTKAAMTDSLGHYVISTLPEGEYLVKASKFTDFYYQEIWYENTAYMENAKPIAILENQTVTNINITFPPMPDSSRIAGIVTDESGEPIPNAFVQLHYANEPWRSSIGGYAETDSSGYYEIPWVQPGNYIVECFTYYGRGIFHQYWQDTENFDEATSLEVVEGTDYLNINFTMPFSRDYASISGIVKNVDGLPLCNARIEVWDENTSGDSLWLDGIWQEKGWTYETAFTDSTGQYTIQNLITGSYQLRVVYFDWNSGLSGECWYENAKTKENATTITLSKNEEKDNINFSIDLIPNYGTISGTVTNQGNNAPIINAVIQIHVSERPVTLDYDFWTYQSILSTVTDAEGKYEFNQLPEGEYKVVAYTNGGSIWYPDAIVKELADSVNVIPGEEASIDISIPIRNEGEGAISGTVTSGWSGWFENGVDSMISSRPYWEDNAPLPNAVVMAKPAITILSWPESEQFYCGVSDSLGEYTIPGLPDGEYLVSAFAADHLYQYFNQDYQPSEPELVTVKNSEIVYGINFNLYPALLCWDEMDINSRNGVDISGLVLDEAGNPIYNATVYLYLNDQPVGYVMTDENGNFQFGNLNQGNYTIQANKPGVGNAYLGGSQDLTGAQIINLGNQSQNVQIELGNNTAVELGALKPEILELLGNYPNPFNPATEIRFALPEVEMITLTIYNELGQKIAQLCNKELSAGCHSFLWNGLNAFNQPVTSGLYFYQLKTENRALVGKMMLIR